MKKFKLKDKQEAMKKAAIDFSHGVPIDEVMKKYDVSYASVYKAIKRYNIKYHYTNGRTIFFDEKFFEKIDTEEKAYWLGFIFADGSVIKTDHKVSDYNRLSIAVAIKDKSHLEKFARSIKYPAEKIHTTKNHGYNCDKDICYLRCNSILMAKHLISHNCLPNKTFKHCFPKVNDIPDALVNHFVRGYFDGDGSISISQKRKSYIFSISSEPYACECIQKILMKKCNLRKTKIALNKNIGVLTYGGRLQVERIFHYLYDNASVYLDRKYTKFYTAFFNAV